MRQNDALPTQGEEPTPVRIVKRPPPIYRAPVLAAVAVLVILGVLHMMAWGWVLACCFVALLVLSYRPPVRR